MLYYSYYRLLLLIFLILTISAVINLTLFTPIEKIRNFLLHRYASIHAVSTPLAISSRDEQNIMAKMEQALPTILTEDDYHKALLLRNYVYHYTTVGNGEFNYPFTYTEFENIVNGQQPMLCGGIAYFYSALLQLFGVPNRIINLATSAAVEGKSPKDTHVTVEILNNEINNNRDGNAGTSAYNWIIEDPTFNVEWQVYDDTARKYVPIGAIQYYQSLTAGIIPRSSSNGFPINIQRSVGYYAHTHLPYKNLLQHIAIGYASIYGPTAGITIYKQSYPDAVVWLYNVTSNKLGAIRNGTEIENFDFSQGIPSNWLLTNDDATFYIENASTHIITDFSQWNYITQSNPVKLNACHYQLVVHGNIGSGGIGIIVVNADSNKGISYNHFYAQQLYSLPAGEGMVVDFNLNQPTKVEFILCNYSMEAVYSNWDIRKITLTQIS